MNATLRGRWLLTGTGPPVRDGQLEIRAGRVAYAGSRRDATGKVVDYGAAVILPGLVNAHTHLELTDLAGRVPPGRDFVNWLRKLMTRAAESPPTERTVQEAVRAGVRQSLAAGVTTIGDITRFPAWTRPVLAESGLRGVSFGEVVAIGARRGLLSDRLEAAADAAHASDRLRIGLSPHAPYTVEPEALRACAARAQRDGLPMCMHLGETREEDDFVRDRTGPFADYLRGLGVWDSAIPASGCGAFELARRCGVLRPGTLIAHGNYLTDEQIDWLAEAGVSVAYCPRTHAAFGHAPHPFRRMLAAGVNVCLGTDSLASNPSLSILDELRFLHRTCPDVPPEALLQMATVNGARALKVSHEVGCLKPGRDADVVALRAVEAEFSSPFDWLLDGHTTVECVWIRGAPVVARSRH